MMTMIDFLISVCLVALLSAFIILLLTKWRIVEWLQVNGGDFFGKMAECHLCMGFWVAVILSAIAVYITGDYMLMFVPVFSSPLTRYIL